MSAGKHDFPIEQGATFNPVITWKDENDTVIDLTNYTARMQIRSSVRSTTTLEEITTENGGITLGDALGTISLLITATATTAYSFRTGVYDLELIDAGGIVTRLLAGAITVSSEVTR